MFSKTKWIKSLMLVILSENESKLPLKFKKLKNIIGGELESSIK